MMEAIGQDALSLVVLRAILGFSPPEWAYIATEETEVGVSQNFARAIDREVRVNRHLFERCTTLRRERIAAMVSVGCQLINEGAIESPEGMIHRLDKADTRQGQKSVQHLAHQGVPYAMLLYERFLGRPFASHRDSISGIIGHVVEDAVESQLRKYREFPPNTACRKHRGLRPGTGFHHPR